LESAAAHRRLAYEAKSGSRSGLVRRPTATLGPEGVQRVIRHRLSHDRVGQRPRPTPSCPQRNARPGQGLQLSLATRASLGASLGAIKFFFAVFTPPPPGCSRPSAPGDSEPLEIMGKWMHLSQPAASQRRLDSLSNRNRKTNENHANHGRVLACVRAEDEGVQSTTCPIWPARVPFLGCMRSHPCHRQRRMPAGLRAIVLEPDT